MSKSNTQESGYLKLVYQNINLANIGDVTGLRNSSTAGSFFIALYTSSPTDSDTGTEANYTGYTRVAVARSVIGFTVSGNSCVNASQVLFPVSSGVSNIVTHFAIRTASSGGDMVHYGALSASSTIGSGDTPKFNAGDLTITED